MTNGKHTEYCSFRTSYSGLFATGYTAVFTASHVVEDVAVAAGFSEHSAEAWTMYLLPIIPAVVFVWAIRKWTRGAGMADATLDSQATSN